MSILARLAQLQGITIDGLEPPRTTQTQDRTQVRNRVSAPVFDFAPDKTVEEVVEESEGAAEGEPGIRTPDVITEPPGSSEPPETTQPPVGDTGGSRTVVSIQTISRNGRNIIQTIYSDGSIEEQDLGPVGSPPPPPKDPGTGEEEGEETEEFDAREYALTNYEWLGEELIDIFLEEYNSNGGDDEEAIRVLRTTQAYKDKFKGIFRDDGKTLRIEGNQPERQYIKIKEDYQNLLADYNLNPEFFENKIETLFRNDVAPRTFEERLSVAYNTLFPQFEAVKTYYVQNYPNLFPSTEDITDEAIFASFIDEDVSADIISQRVNISQIGGAFLEQDFAISTEQAQRLVSAGVGGAGAQALAARAETQLPRLQRLAQRFTGREDIFGLSEFIEAEVFGSGVAERVRERLEAEQASVFTREGGAAISQSGVTGLVEQ